MIEHRNRLHAQIVDQQALRVQKIPAVGLAAAEIGVAEPCQQIVCRGIERVDAAVAQRVFHAMQQERFPQTASAVQQQRFDFAARNARGIVLAFAPDNAHVFALRHV